MGKAMCAGRQVILRPVLTAAKDSHDWTVGVSEGPHGIRLNALEDGATRLLACLNNREPGLALDLTFKLVPSSFEPAVICIYHSPPTKYGIRKANRHACLVCTEPCRVWQAQSQPARNSDRERLTQELQ